MKELMEDVLRKLWSNGGATYGNEKALFLLDAEKFDEESAEKDEKIEELEAKVEEQNDVVQEILDDELYTTVKGNFYTDQNHLCEDFEGWDEDDVDTLIESLVTDITKVFKGEK